MRGAAPSTGSGPLCIANDTCVSVRLRVESASVPCSVDVGINGARLSVKVKPLVMLARVCSEQAANRWLRELGQDARTTLGIFACRWEGAAGPDTLSCEVGAVEKLLERAADEKDTHAAGQGLGDARGQSASQGERTAAVFAIQQAGKDEAQKILAARQDAISADRKAMVESLGGTCTEEDVDAVHLARTECASRLVAEEEATKRQKEAPCGTDKKRAAHMLAEARRAVFQKDPTKRPSPPSVQTSGGQRIAAGFIGEQLDRHGILRAVPRDLQTGCALFGSQAP